MNFLAIDFETANYQRHSACSVGLVKVEAGVGTEKIVYIIGPPPRMNLSLPTFMGFKWSDVALTDDFGKLWPRIQSLFEGIDFLAAHNASFDKGVLHACCQLYKIEIPEIPFQCSMQLARKRLGIYPTKLSDVCRHLKNELNHHEALSDAHACT
ncbi:MAG TPA: exonuclease domain-containing protein [Pseudobdellovibrionaceae bacterium]|jgi:DNA polymerase-3 subunit epsilon